jgi:transglutaminase superfamily protein
VTLGDLVVGGWAALRTPYWLSGARLESLLQVPEVSPGRPLAPERVRAARGILRRLARLPRSPWRSTCLYRCTAEVLLRRAAGEPARLQLGVRKAGEEIGAHAWVECDGRPVGPESADAAQYSLLA